MTSATRDHDVLADNVGEDVKAYVHLALFGLLYTVAVYNAVACAVRPELRLVVNTCVYAAGALFEVPQIRRHLRRG